MIDKEFLLGEKKRIEEEHIEVFKELMDLADSVIREYEDKGYDLERMAGHTCTLLACCNRSEGWYSRLELVYMYLSKLEKEDVFYV